MHNIIFVMPTMFSFLVKEVLIMEFFLKSLLQDL